MRTFKIKSELSEKQIESDISYCFGVISPLSQPLKFRLYDIDEQLTGADKHFNLVIPIYMQFKVSHGLKKYKGTPRLSPLQKIRKFRHDKCLEDDPTLYFKLRAKASTALDFQHNILMKLANTGRSHAFYVAPLSLTQQEHAQNLNMSFNKIMTDPFYHKLCVEIHQQNWVSYFGSIPSLKAHISIIPHETISTDNHYYSFSKIGGEIGWHSPQLVTSPENLLSDRLNSIFTSAFHDQSYWTSPTELISLLERLQLGINVPNYANEDNYQIERLNMIGRQLKEKFNIRQLLLLTTRNFLEELKRVK